MPSRRSQIVGTKQREERKKRQEKFTKRTRSLFNKTRLLAKDTDAWVALIVRDRAGRVKSFRSSGRRYWPPSIQDLMTAHPSGTHEFLEKYAIAGCWKEVAEDDSDAGLVDCDEESVDEGVLATSVIAVEKEAGPDSTISVDQCHVSEDIQDGANTPRDEPNETAVEKSAVDPLGGSDITLLQLEELDGTLVDAEKSHDATFNPVGGFGNSRVDSPEKDIALGLGMGDDTIFNIGEPDNMTVNAIEESDNTTADMAVDLHNTTAPKLGNSDTAPDVPGEAIWVDMLGTADPDPIVSEYDMMDVDIPGAKSKPQPGEGDPIEVANALCTMSQYHNPLSSVGLGSWQVVNRPKMDPRELLRSWNWVFQNRNH